MSTDGSDGVSTEYDRGPVAAPDIGSRADQPTEGGSDAGADDDVVLRTDGLTRTFGSLVAVNDLNLAFERGSFHSIIGPNGAGKTTLFNLISGALAPTQGEIFFHGERITDLRPHERVGHGLARSFQISDVFDGLSVYENVHLAAQRRRYESMSMIDRFLTPTERYEAIAEWTATVLEQIDMSAVAETPASELPYGDRRRLEIGIVLATDPDVVLLDEPTAGMSPENTQETIDLIQSLLKAQTLILVEHDIDFVMQISDRISVLHNGRHIAEGKPNEIAANEDVRAVYFGREVSRP